MSKYLKTIIAVVGGTITSCLVLFPPDSQTYQVLAVISAALTAAGVYLFPNREGSTPPPEEAP